MISTSSSSFSDNPQQSFFPILGANDEPRGVLHEHHVKGEFITRSVVTY